jgi:acetyltransferase-like isoleucine patch superfamily enzyme
MKKITRFIKYPYFEKIYLLYSLYSELIGVLFYRHTFARFGSRSWIKAPDQIVGSENIHIGNYTHIEKGAVLYAIREYSGLIYNGQINIGDYVYLNRMFNASSAAKINIGNHVACGSNVSLLNYNHGWENIDRDINSSPLFVCGDINIGDDTWLGSNVSVLGKVSIGKHCVVGAGSIVTHDIPDYSVAVGSPAKVIKKYDHDTSSWTNVSE